MMCHGPFYDITLGHTNDLYVLFLPIPTFYYLQTKYLFYQGLFCYITVGPSLLGGTDCILLYNRRTYFIM